MGRQANHQISGEVDLQTIVGFETDEALAARAASDPAALGTLYERYLPAVHQYCRYRLNDDALAEDTTATIFLKMVEGLGRSSVERVRPWLFTIAHHEVVSAYRRRRSDVGLESVRDTAHGGPTPEELAVVAGDVAMLREQLARLTPAEQDVIELRLAGLSGPEIAEVLRQSYSWVGTTQHRAYTRLRGLMHVSIERSDGR